MRRFHREFGHDYGSYRFGYTVWTEREDGEALEPLYAEGFLPFSGRAGERNLLYMARSVRIDLRRFAPSSENRRILRKADGELTREPVPFTAFDADPAFRSFCEHYFRERLGMEIVESGKLAAILEAGFLTTVVRYRDGNGEPAAYVLLVEEEDFSHYWFSCYLPGQVSSSRGMWLMLQEAQAAQSAGRSWLYLGTCYSPASLYKTNLGPLQWWDGSAWIEDPARLKALVRSS